MFSQKEKRSAKYHRAVLRNQARQQLKSMVKRSNDQQAIKQVAAKFHQYLHQHSKALRAEKNVLSRLEGRHARKECAKNVWKFAGLILNDDNHLADVEPTFGEVVAEEYFTAMYSSEARLFERPAWLPNANSPKVSFNDDPISFDEIQQVIKKSCSQSSPSPFDQITYTIFKHYPSVALLNLFNLCWQEGRVPQN